MGICLDTDSSEPENSEENSRWKGTEKNSDQIETISDANILNRNTDKIKFDPPKVPVIFVLGGPGSGKVTHCDTLMQERRGVVHINMMDLLQQYAMGNDLQDFSQLSSKTVTEVLMLEMKMAPAAKAYLISGYPRSMRDVVEYSEKIQVINGAILISWRQSVLQKQIDYGAKLGHVVLSLAKMELDNFFKNVMPVADYFDQSDILVAINGERSPAEVYKDFQTAVLDILNALENQEAILNGVSGMGRGANDIPGSIVSVETAPSQENNTNKMIDPLPNENPNENTIATNTNSNISNLPMPPCIFVIGGPGSNKAALCAKLAAHDLNLGHISIGRLLREISDSEPRANSEGYTIKEALTVGEMVPASIVETILENNINEIKNKRAIIIDGYPRNMEQANLFEKKYKQRPPVILLDCSKLQLGRGRLDDTVSSFRRRLELFREETLPMLKQLDSIRRLTIVDGDTDSLTVQTEFENVIKEHIKNLIINNNLQGSSSSYTSFSQSIRNANDIIQEENVPGTVPTISHQISLQNGDIGKPIHKNLYNKTSSSGYMNGQIMNGGREHYNQRINNTSNANYSESYM
ncbi:adenylate kinase isoenzyme 5 [Condylostylus longicornis]|uniref:adenylate kinase isoenzyme 5 n=1 Tax=Condylostylus longicornis TaxID=2530218 RepID=UPI00244E0335|nr:adenylate kinase isoenzyme 5 [Condylostylus longicornis]